jgi:hypothetical protein
MRASYLPLRVVTLLIALLTIVVASNGAVADTMPSLALPNTLRHAYSEDNIIGAYSSIETDNPSVGNGWVYHRIFVRNNESTASYWSEIGWVKGYGGYSSPTVYVTWIDAWQNRGEWFGSSPTVGTSYNYQATNNQSGTWSFYFNSLSTPVHTENLVWSVGDTSAHGGETSSTAVDMGNVDYANSSYRQDSNGSWLCACYTSEYNNSTSDYEVIYGGQPSDDWTVRDK